MLEFRTLPVMENLAWLAAIPLLVLGWHVAGIVRGRLSKSEALRKLPDAVKDLGLVSSEGGGPGRFATYNLEYGGRKIRVAPETRGFVLMHTSAEIPWRISTLKMDARKPGMQYFETGDAEFDSLFKSRYAEPEVAERLRSNGEARKQLIAGASSDTLGAKWVQLDEHGVSMSAKEAHAMGAPGYIRAEGLAERLDALGELAARVEVAFASQYPRDA